MASNTLTLTPKQIQFVAEYLIDLNATQAAIRAGYSEKTAEQQGYQLLQKTSVSDAIQKAMDKRVDRTGITADFVLNGIKSVIERCEKEYPVRDREGKETGEYRFEANPALKGYELLGKHLKLFTDKSEIDHKLTGSLNLIYDTTLEPAEAYKNLIHGKT